LGVLRELPRRRDGSSSSTQRVRDRCAILGFMSTIEPTSRVTFKGATEASVVVQFEPIGTTFDVTADEFVVLQLPQWVVSSVEVVVWPTGISVWVPYPGDYVILDHEGRELDRL
jgi:hypothetical protein